jgi:hypothetical protein
MKTISTQYNITDEQLKEALDYNTINYDSFILHNISTSPSSYGHYRITVEYLINGDEEFLTSESITTDTTLIDAWRDGEDEVKYNDYYDNWQEVVNSMVGNI